MIVSLLGPCVSWSQCQLKGKGMRVWPRKATAREEEACLFVCLGSNLGLHHHSPTVQPYLTAHHTPGKFQTAQGRCGCISCDHSLVYTTLLRDSLQNTNPELPKSQGRAPGKPQQPWGQDSGDSARIIKPPSGAQSFNSTLLLQDDFLWELSDLLSPE